MEQHGHVSMEIGFEVDPQVGEVSLEDAIAVVRGIAEDRLLRESQGPFAINRVRLTAAAMVTDEPEGPAVIG